MARRREGGRGTMQGGERSLFPAAAASCRERKRNGSGGGRRSKKRSHKRRTTSPARRVATSMMGRHRVVGKHLQYIFRRLPRHDGATIVPYTNDGMHDCTEGEGGVGGGGGGGGGRTRGFSRGDTGKVKGMVGAPKDGGARSASSAGGAMQGIATGERWMTVEWRTTGARPTTSPCGGGGGGGALGWWNDRSTRFHSHGSQ